MFAHGSDGVSGASAGAREQRHLAAERLTRRSGDLHRDDLPGAGQAVEVHDLVVTGATADAARIGPRRAFDEHVERAADEPLRPLPGATLHDLDEALESLDRRLVRDEILGERGRLGATTRRVDERE